MENHLLLRITIFGTGPAGLFYVKANDALMGHSTRKFGISLL